MNRFFLDPQLWNASPVRLSEHESHHAVHVLRLTVGDRLTVFDGRGTEATATLRDTGRESVISLGPPQHTPPLACQLTLAQAIPKGKTMDFVVQKAVELGAARVAPLVSERTVVRLDPEEAKKKCQKWHDVAIEACKQCGQNVVPEILCPSTPSGFLESAPKDGLLLVASLQPGARRIHEILDEYRNLHAGDLPRSATILVGPEGDFTPAETASALSAGCQPVTLGPIILRTETAALYCLSVLAHELF